MALKRVTLEGAVVYVFCDEDPPAEALRAGEWALYTCGRATAWVEAHVPYNIAARALRALRRFRRGRIERGVGVPTDGSQADLVTAGAVVPTVGPRVPQSIDGAGRGR